MPNFKTLKRREQRARAQRRQNAAPLPPGFCDDIQRVLKDIYAPALREMFNNSDVLLAHLGKPTNLGGDYYMRVPASLSC